MLGTMQAIEPMVLRRVFPGWSLEIPETFVETIGESGCWLAYGDSRSVRMTSIALDGKRGPAPAKEIEAMLVPIDGVPVAARPAGLRGRAAIRELDEDGETSQVLQGLLAVKGHVLLVTIIGGDTEWAMRTWRSVRHHPCRHSGSRRRR